MDLSLSLLILSSLFIVPSIFLSLNRLRTYLIPALISTCVLLFILFLGRFFAIEESLGSSFSFLSSFILDDYIELSETERFHLSYWFFLLLLYFLIYLAVFLIVKKFFIGSNPSIHKQVRRFRQVLASLLFLICTYSMLSLFLIEIRQILPFSDGMFSFLFQVIHPIEA